METGFSFAVNSFRFLSLLASGGAQEKEANNVGNNNKNKNIKNQTLKPCDLHSSRLLATCIP